MKRKLKNLILNSGPSYDSDAQTFFTAASITDATIKTAWNTAVLSLKSNSLWTTGIGIYPVVGGTAGAHAVNAKTPGTFNLTFAGGWTHAATGATPNGSTGDADTGIYGDTSLSQDSTAIGMYSRTSNTTNAFDISAGGNAAEVLCIYYGGNALFRINNNTNSSVASPGTTKMFIASRTAADAVSLYRDGTSIKDDNKTSATLQHQTIHFGSYNNSSDFSNKESAFWWVGTGLTAGQAATLTTIINTFQTALGRNV